MAIVNVTINGCKIEAQAGQTVLQAATAAGIDVPVLCHHPALQPQGSCRMCLVEIEKQRSLQPACTFPVTEGMVAYTESEKVVAARKFVLELLFSERIHYCMYCAMSGTEEDTDCELQRLAYRYGLTNWKYAPNTKKRWPVDASRKYFFMDHSRCILCRRCIRACDEIAANHTLGVRDRGARTMVIADADVPFGESSCVSCGTCLQVCPTGALIDRRSAYMGHMATDVDRTQTTCMACPVGCGIEAVSRDNLLLRVQGDWNAANGGLLCVEGRFAVVEPQPERLASPLVRKNGALAPASWDEALSVVASRLKAAGPVAGLVSPKATTETLEAFGKFFTQVVGSDQVSLLYGQVPALDLGARASLSDLAGADYIAVIGGEPLEDQKVLGYLAKRAVDHEAKLIVVSDTPTELDAQARERLPLARAGEVASAVEAAARPVVLYAAGLAPAVYALLRGLAAKTRFLPLYTGTNAAGAAQAGIGSRDVRGVALYVLAGDDLTNGRPLPEAEFTVVQAAYRTAWTEAADVVLPAQLWTEKAGHIINVEGRVLPVVPSTQTPAGLPADMTTLVTLSERMGHPLA